MEYYDIRKSGKDIDFVITDRDYKNFAKKYPEKRKDLYGDLGVTIDEFEIWRSIAHLDYEFFRKEAIDEGDFLVISIERLLCLLFGFDTYYIKRNKVYEFEIYYLEVDDLKHKKVLAEIICEVLFNVVLNKKIAVPSKEIRYPIVFYVTMLVLNGLIRILLIH